MARAAAGEVSKSSIFRGYFRAKPELLKVKGYAELFDLYRADHPDQELTTRDRQIAANVKTAENKKVGGGRAGKKKGKVAKATAVAAAPRAKVVSHDDELDTVEASILEIINQLKGFGDKGLTDVILSLRKARYQLILKIAGD